MSKIEEMALEAYPVNMLDDLDLAKIPRRAYLEGANAVLNEIEQLIYEKHVEGNLPLFDLTHLIDKLKK